MLYIGERWFINEKEKIPLETMRWRDDESEAQEDLKYIFRFR